MSAASVALALHALIVAGLMIRVLLRSHREPASRVAWLAVLAALPVVGIVAYVLFGEVRTGRKRATRLRQVIGRLPPLAAPAAGDEERCAPRPSEAYSHLFAVGQSISGFEPLGGNHAHLLDDSNATIDAMVRDMDAAETHIHLLFYIWLPDNNGSKIIEALKRAAARGVTCRAMADDLGSRLLVHSTHWQAMRDAGVHLATALPIGNPLLRALTGRIDLRNHRKILIIDDRVTYCGSQNCADPEFRVKPKFAPWVDAVARFEGPVVRQNQHLFAADWMTSVDEDLTELLGTPLPSSSVPGSGFSAQVIGTGPTSRNSAMPELFESILYAARRELLITTPYYVPDESLQGALCAAARRDVAVTIIFPARNDSWIVAAASRSYYLGLLDAGVAIHEYVGGLLHTKSLTVDGEVTLIGSANMDRRSFDLNYENNILACDRTLTAAVRERQQLYLSRSHQVTAEMVRRWSISHRLWNNAIATLGPVL